MTDAELIKDIAGCIVWAFRFANSWIASPAKRFVPAGQYLGEAFETADRLTDEMAQKRAYTLIRAARLTIEAM